MEELHFRPLQANTVKSRAEYLCFSTNFIADFELSSYLQVMCPTCLCTGMALASEHDPRIDPFQ